MGNVTQEMLDEWQGERKQKAMQYKNHLNHILNQLEDVRLFIANEMPNCCAGQEFYREKSIELANELMEILKDTMITI